MRRLHAWTALLGLALASPAFAEGEGEPPAAAPAYPDGIVALVEGSPITRYELELACLLQRQRYSTLEAGSAEAAAIRSEVLDVLIQMRVLVARAKDEGLEFTEADQQRLDAQLAREARRYGGDGGMEDVLAQIGVPYRFLVSWHRTAMLRDKLLVRKISMEIYVSPAELRRHYQENQRRFELSGETRFRQIVAYRDPRDAVRLPELAAEASKNGDWSPRAYLEGLRERCRRGEPFAALALAGSMGVKHDAEFVVEAVEDLAPPLNEVVAALEPGGLSAVVERRRDGAFFLVQLVDRRERGPRPFEQVQAEIEEELKNEIWRRRVGAWIDQAVEEAFVARFLPRPAPPEPGDRPK